MDMYQNNGPQYQFEQPDYQNKNTMSSASMIMGLLTVVTTIMCTVYIPFITCGLAVLFAILSKGKHKKMNSSARTGTIAAISGLVLNILLIVGIIYLYMNVPEIHEQANQLFEQQYGTSIDEMFDALYGTY